MSLLSLVMSVLAHEFQDSLDRVEIRLEHIDRKLDRLMSGTQTLDTDISALKQQVQQNADVVQSATTLINGLAGQLSALQGQLQQAGVQPAQLAALNDLIGSFHGQTQALAAAVAANTVADPNTAGGGVAAQNPAPVEAAPAAPAGGPAVSTSTEGAAQPDQA